MAEMGHKVVVARERVLHNGTTLYTAIHPRISKFSIALHCSGVGAGR
jgi:hypothetical protein